MLYAVLSGFVLAGFVPWLAALSRQYIGLVLAILPASLTFWFALQIPAVSDGSILLQSWQWLPGLGINLGFMLDGLSLLFALLISFIGTFILIYAGAYLQGHPYLARFYMIILCFMAAMLGLVLSDNLVTLFVFWELTSITSYLLIGFNHQDKAARDAALQGLLVTVGGGLALMAGLIMLAAAAGTYQLSALLSEPALIRQSPWLTAMMLCILLGAFTKSAQFPFHFWLPNAMAAPTPVSAYLHSATMVKAGIYLMARLNPVFSGQELWHTLLPIVGAMTMLSGAWLAYSASSLKKVLAYSTVMALGTLTLLIGIGTEYAMVAFVCYLLAHSLYKGALFMLAGVIDWSTGSKDLQTLSGLRQAMPVTAVLVLLACLSLAGIPFLFGFVAKELLFETVLSTDMPELWVSASFLASALTAAVALVLAIRPFTGQLSGVAQTPREAGIAMLAGPMVLAGLSLLFGIWPVLAGNWLVGAAVQVVGKPGQTVSLAVWHGINIPLLLSIVSILLATALFFLWARSRQAISRVNKVLAQFGPEAGYFRLLDATLAFAAWQTRVLQNGKTGNYLLVLILSVVGLVAYTLLSQYGLKLAMPFEDLRFYEVIVASLMVMTVAYVIVTRSRLGAVVTMGVLGFSVALMFILFSAPDLGITQVLVETLTVILLVLVLFRLPGFSRYSSRYEVIRDASVAIAFGITMTLVMLAAIDVRYFEPISDYYLINSYALAQGSNVVNVILVDFRALDTLGEIFVLGIAALGVFSMLRLRAEGRRDES